MRYEVYTLHCRHGSLTFTRPYTSLLAAMRQAWEDERAGRWRCERITRAAPPGEWDGAAMAAYWAKHGWDWLEAPGAEDGRGA